VGLYTVTDPTFTTFFVHFFVREPNGNFISFDPNDVMTSFALPYNGTTLSINPNGDTSGWYIGSDNIYHGFLRDHKGVVISAAQFDPGGALAQFTLAFGLNPSDTTVGQGINPVDLGYHGWVRDAKGNVSYFDGAPGAPTTSPFAVNPAGVIVGSFQKAVEVFGGA
jgi:hypothetical protein